jgi:hypothetical protein
LVPQLAYIARPPLDNRWESRRGVFVIRLKLSLHAFRLDFIIASSCHGRKERTASSPVANIFYIRWNLAPEICVFELFPAADSWECPPG